jgi:6,7-dimethyl-8-ribityllumazine synthase
VILAADFTKSVVDVMVEEATREAAASGIELTKVVRVPGAYEVPLIADVLLAKPDVDFVVVLGYIERGETRHGEVMGHVVHAALVDMQLRHRKPIGLGIIGPGATREQAEQRKADYARAAVTAALRSWTVLREEEQHKQLSAVKHPI